MHINRNNFVNTRRLVVKVGSSSLTYDTGRPNLSQMEALVRQLADVHNSGRDVLLVSSGAIGLGVNRLGFKERPRNMPEKQAAAAVGQGLLMHMYEKFFSEYGITVGQVLLNRQDFSDRKRFLNARNTLYALMGMGVIPIINENDTLAVEEIKLGDNDTLSALVSGLVDADLLILLSDIDGLYTADPRCHPEARLVSEVRDINAETEGMAGGAGSSVGTGGMATKIYAARIAMQSGLATVVARAGERDIIRKVLAGEEWGTVFWPTAKLENKKQWIAFSSAIQGKIQVDAGAVEVLVNRGKSLLPSGVARVEGNFDVGNTVSIVGPDETEVARGVVNYSAGEIDSIKGLHTNEIERVLGHKDYDEIIHRNNLVICV